MSDTGKFTPPKEDNLDKFISVLGVASSAASFIEPSIPILYALGIQLLGTPVKKRMEKCMELIGETLQELTTTERLRLEDLQENQLFIDCVLKATTIAIRNNHEAKQEALKRIMQNAAKPNPDEVFLQTALNFIDTSTAWHLIILKFLANPRAWEKENGKKIPNVLGINLYFILKEAYPELKNDKDLIEQIFTDLWVRGLIESHPERDAGLVSEPTLENLMKENITFMGKRMLAILNP